MTYARKSCSQSLSPDTPISRRARLNRGCLRSSAMSSPRIFSAIGSARWYEPMSEIPEIGTDDESSLAVELSDGLSQLSSNQLEALRLTKLSGFSIAEAAMHAGTSVGSMKVRVHRAYESLKRSILR